MKLLTRFDYDRVDHSKDNTVHLLVSLEAPATEWADKRPTVCVLPVIDVSGSMRGDKLEYAKKSCLKLVEHLSPGDITGLVVFSSIAKVAVKPDKVTPEFKANLVRAIKGLREGGGTNFSDALLKATKSIQDLDLPPKVLQRIIFFTDGQPTSGVTEPAIINNTLQTEMAKSSLTASFFGYGAENDWGGCDHDFLTRLSKTGRGNYAHVEDPEETLTAFGRELGGLLSTYAVDLQLVLEPQNGHEIVKVVTDVSEKADAMGERTFDLGDILGEETRHVVVECSLKEQKSSFPREFPIVEARVTYRRVLEAGGRESEKETSTAKVRFVKAKDAQEKPTPEVDEIVALHQMARTQLEAEAEANQGKYREAADRMAQFSAQSKDRGLQGIAAASHNLSVNMANADAYRGSQLYRRGMSGGILRSAGVSNLNSSAAADLGGYVSYTSAQEAVTSSFTGGGGTSTSAPPNPEPLPIPDPTPSEDS